MSRKDSILHPVKHWSVPWPLRLLFAVLLIGLPPTLACGSFAPRPTPTPTVVVITTQGSDPAIGQTTEATPVVLPTPVTPTPLPTLLPVDTPTFTPTPLPGTVLAVGQPARVVAPDGLNMREQPDPDGTLIIHLNDGVRVTVVEGPQNAADFNWWKVDDGQGNTGWVAERDAETEWLSPKLGEVRVVDRPPRVGDRVEVTTDELSVRVVPGTDTQVVRRINLGSQYTVQAGPQTANGYTWYQIRSDDGSMEGWVADGDDETRWLSPLE